MHQIRIAVALALVLVAGCGGGTQKPAPDPDPDPVSPEPTQPSELQRRQNAACEQLGPKVTACAIDDARKNLSPAELAELDLEKTGPIHTREYIKECQAETLSSRQVRVKEVCLREETECDALDACLKHGAPQPRE
jgi:hypothetical protein